MANMIIPITLIYMIIMIILIMIILTNSTFTMLLCCIPANVQMLNSVNP